MAKSVAASDLNDSTLYFHFTNRCVRQAFIAGADDHYHYDHRRDWFHQRLSLLTQMFAIEVLTVNIQPHHYQLVVKLNPDQAAQWPQREIISRWSMLYRLPTALQTLPLPDDADTIALLELWRSRLCDLSWFLRCLHQYIAEKANAEDGCRGHFWERRGKTKKLASTAALKLALNTLDSEASAIAET
jgi:hypothetical protein